MRFFYTLPVVATALLITACSTNHANDYLQAQEGPSLKLPSNLSSYAMQPEYPIPAGPAWNSDKPVSPYPPGSSLARKMQPSTEATQQIVIIGVDPEGSPSLNIAKSYDDVWAQLPKSFQALGFTVKDSDAQAHRYTVMKDNVTYLFLVVQTDLNNTLISVADATGNTLSDKDSKAIMTQLQAQFLTVWK
ncbi:MAG: outer membrane protein assembly factor BamC [Gammaproteobacteria bacterium]|nr:outer membrane protein assembly factor BamC [Gammaproteobacteria bacterium]